ncbi:MAG TPA: shikimate dehydrogenase [Burkholderiales bacterium]|nr:shikimate dehydrogenase [Burkholderiales bacterium]
MSDRYAVIGNPVAHSKSPTIHAAFAQQTGQQLVYEKILAPLDDFCGTVNAFRQNGGRGLNVTLPFKEEALILADDASARANAAGAANTLRFDVDRVYADNTDGVGLVQDIQGNRAFSLQGRSVLLLGAGGAARGVIAPLLEAGVSGLSIANRTVEKAQKLAARFPISAMAYAALTGQVFDLVINATSASLSSELPPLPEGVFAPGAMAYDMMYGKGETPFLAFARSQGATYCADGLGMLVEQAAASFYIWRSVQPATASVLSQLRAALN